MAQSKWLMWLFHFIKCTLRRLWGSRQLCTLIIQSYDLVSGLCRLHAWSSQHPLCSLCMSLPDTTDVPIKRLEVRRWCAYYITIKVGNVLQLHLSHVNRHHVVRKQLLKVRPGCRWEEVSRVNSPCKEHLLPCQNYATLFIFTAFWTWLLRFFTSEWAIICLGVILR